MSFSKEPLSTDQMIDRLRARGLEIQDEASFAYLLTHANYYRLSAYWYPFKIQSPTSEEYFQAGFTEQILLDHYQFDTALRERVFKAISLVEIAMRRHIAFEFAHRHGPFAHLQADLFEDQAKWETTIAIVRADYLKSPTKYAVHFRRVHPELILPPIWATVELMSLGGIRHLFGNIKKRALRQAVAVYFGIDETVLVSLLHHLEQVRNICAHHDRLWNVKFSKVPALPDAIDARHPATFQRASKQPRTIYNSLVLLNYIEGLIHKKETLLDDVEDLLLSYPSVDRRFMGYPESR